MSKPFNPESTIITNIALDRIMPNVSPNAWKILCLAIRKTAGWQDKSTESGRKESDVISISQFRVGCGISSNDTVKNAIDECLNNGYLLRRKEGQSFRYYINQNYELPTVTENVIHTVTENVTPTVTDSVNTNSKVNNNINTINKKEKLPTYAKDNGDSMNKEEYLESVKKSLEKGLSSRTSGYANYPERLVPVVERMERLWNFRAPDRSGKQFSFWISSCDEILVACAEFGVELLDELHSDWSAYLISHNGFAPFTISSPKSLVNAVNGKAALLRGGNKQPMWKINTVTSKPTRLDF